MHLLCTVHWRNQSEAQSLPSVSTNSSQTIIENHKSCNERLCKVLGSLEKEELKAGELKKEDI